MRNFDGGYAALKQNIDELFAWQNKIRKQV